MHCICGVEDGLHQGAMTDICVLHTRVLHMCCLRFEYVLHICCICVAGVDEEPKECLHPGSIVMYVLHTRVLHMCCTCVAGVDEELKECLHPGSMSDVCVLHTRVLHMCCICVAHVLHVLQASKKGSTSVCIKASFQMQIS